MSEPQLRSLAIRPLTAIGTAHTVPTSPVAVWQEASIRDLSITNSAATANASGISYFKVGYSDLTNVYMKGLTGDGFNLQAYTGDIDGSFNVGIHSSKFDAIAGTCINAAGNVLELRTSRSTTALCSMSAAPRRPTSGQRRVHVRNRRTVMASAADRGRRHHRRRRLSGVDRPDRHVQKPRLHAMQ